MYKNTISAKEVAQLLGVSYGLVLEMAKRNAIPHFRAGSRILFRRGSLDEWMAEQEKFSVTTGIR